MQTAIEVGGWVLFAIWAVVSGVPTVWMIGRSLKRQSDRLPDPASWPRVSVIVPARDEGMKIEAGLKSLLASDYLNCEIIAIDDRSRDDTGAIMDRLANASKDELRVVHITDLPDGWLGKNHALQTGYQQSVGEWLLFTDGDVIHAPQTLRQAMRFVVAREIDHLAVFPDFESGGVIETAFVVGFGVVFAAGTQPWLIPTRAPWFYCGVGAFNLVRRSALQRAGGFEPIKLDILDDVKLGMLLKRTGAKSQVLRSGNGLTVRWQSSAWACLTGLEKNAFASMNYSLLQLLWMSGVSSIVFCGPAIGAMFADEARAGYIAAVVVSHLLFGFNSWLSGHSFWLFPMLMPAGLALVFAFLRSGWITLRQGGVRWRDTFYPLSLLRQHIYR